MQTCNQQLVTFLIAVTLLVIALMTVIITMLYVYQNRRISFQQQLTDAQLEIQEETFQQISREIHDNIGLSLTLAKLYLNTFTGIPSQPPPVAIQSSIELISQAIDDLSNISKSLNSEVIKNEGFLRVLEMKLEKIKRTEKFKIMFEVTGEPIFLESQSEVIIYRITQEALNNIIKHSKATEIYINLSYAVESLTVEIRDNGIGINYLAFEKTKSQKMPSGLNNMRKRAKMINGVCKIESHQAGTTVLVTIPLRNEKSIVY